MAPPFFARFPTLARSFSRVPLAALPTPVEPLDRMGRELPGAAGLWVKRDDACAPLYGGNKVRKLELLLGAALAAGARGLLSYGSAGSNHVAATAVHARCFGLRTVFLLLPQPPSRLVRRNLLLALAHGAKLVPCPSGTSMRQAAPVTREELRLFEEEHGFPPAIVPLAGLSPLGTAGSVLAAFELFAQVEAGLLPEPDLFYVAVGSIGTAAGLLLGLKAAGLKTRLVGVRTVQNRFASEELLLEHARQTRELLRSLDPEFPRVRLARHDFELRHGFFGEDYGMFTPAGQQAVRRMGELEGLALEGTYTGKAFAALLADAGAGRLRSKTVLFWMTCTSIDVSEQIAACDYRVLPAPLHAYFEGPLQPLDTEAPP